ncbi:malonyl-CoA decarboxylase [Novosphingobium flavum]|uniref:Malonyl-CoA decarboxylase n=1 Tax=Novosphingobium flavum TaxID=1778672 RepID=A0A7X1FTJ9_9SPHN|nr:malonyl-CoA decarboxylase [Novosphingobium flavum]MBC2666739.1 malonyl-CoA decarboxylase [Novosphingobium flavum]
MVRTSLSQLLQGFSSRGRDLLGRYLPFAAHPAPPARSPVETLLGLARDLLSTRGEASGVAIASDLLALYAEIDGGERAAFFERLADDFNPDPERLAAAWGRYAAEGWSMLPELATAVEAPRQRLFRLLNLGKGGTAALVRMREDLLSIRGQDWARRVDADLSHLLASWFNRGFLTLQAINWSSPASLLERVIRYEAVHDIRDWAELRSRLDPPDRRCFAFFHPAMPDEPLIFVEVALTKGIPESIQDVLAPDRVPLRADEADTAVFYSISNCQPGLRGISFGHFLIKQVATDIRRVLPGLDCFVTLSPIPGFVSWLKDTKPDLAAAVLAEGKSDEVRMDLLQAGVDYFLEAKSADGRPVDPVARFHLGNGARLERLNWMGDSSPKGIRQSAGMMVNYLYDLAAIEELHEAYSNQGQITIGKHFRHLMERLGAGTRKQMELQHD